MQFPKDFKASYRIHNGQTSYETGLINAREFLSLGRMQDEWKFWKSVHDNGDLEDYKSDPIGSIRDDWWNPARIPITYDGSGNHDCLDLAPGEGGRVGQIIDFYHDEATREVEAESFAAWFAAYVEGCETGKYVCDEHNNIVDKELL
jgi:cell wall assembly regulator SMI1